MSDKVLIKIAKNYVIEIILIIVIYYVIFYFCYYFCKKSDCSRGIVE